MLPGSDSGKRANEVAPPGSPEVTDVFLACAAGTKSPLLLLLSHSQKKDGPRRTFHHSHI